MNIGLLIILLLAAMVAVVVEFNIIARMSKARTVRTGGYVPVENTTQEPDFLENVMRVVFMITWGVVALLFLFLFAGAIFA